MAAAKAATKSDRSGLGAFAWPAGRNTGQRGKSAFAAKTGVRMWAEIVSFASIAVRQALFPCLLLLLHCGAVVEALLQGDLLRALYFAGGALLTLAVVAMAVYQ
jgi:hypothetical protein